MPIAVTCQCGAKLEIDEKFLGKEILCPDCQRPLPTKASEKPPPLDLPDYRRVDGMAVWSLALALAGAFTVIGSVAAIFLGLLALKRIAAQPTKLEGIPLARAGIAVGGFCTFLTVAAFFSPTIFGLDAFLRDLALGGRLNYLVDDPVKDATEDVFLHRPPRTKRSWARYQSPMKATAGVENDNLILVDTWDDAFIAVQKVDLQGGDERDEDVRQAKVLERFRKSELVNLTGRLGTQPPPELTIVEKKAVGADRMEIVVDVRLAGIERRVLLQYKTRENIRLFVLIGCARKNAFERLEDDFRKAFDTFKSNL